METIQKIIDNLETFDFDTLWDDPVYGKPLGKVFDPDNIVGSALILGEINECYKGKLGTYNEYRGDTWCSMRMSHGWFNPEVYKERSNYEYSVIISKQYKERLSALDNSLYNELVKETEKFAKLQYTIGNFVVLPQANCYLNLNKNEFFKDLPDRFLRALKEYYNGENPAGKFESAKNLLPESFQEFVVINDLQDWIVNGEVKMFPSWNEESWKTPSWKLSFKRDDSIFLRYNEILLEQTKEINRLIVARTKRIIKRLKENNNMYREIKGDLFTAPLDTLLIHSVSSDAAFGAGIARIFAKKYWHDLQTIRDNFASTGNPVGTAFYSKGNHQLHRVAHLFAKPFAHYKPVNHEALYDCLREVAKYAKENDIQEIAMPLIGSGLDAIHEPGRFGADWLEIKEYVKHIFADFNVTVYYL